MTADLTVPLSAAAVLGVSAGVVSLVDPLPYIRDVVGGRTRPHRGTWLIWSVLSAVAFAAQWAAGGGWSLLMIGVQTVSIGVVFLLAIPRGVGGVSVPDVALIAVAGCGVVGWLVLSEPLVATVCVVLADVCGVLLMLPKTWRDPWSETASTFVLAGVSGLLSAGAAAATAPELLVYPVYFALANGVTAGVILTRRRVVGPRVRPLSDAVCASVGQP
jgi:hypothetical protein